LDGSNGSLLFSGAAFSLFLKQILQLNARAEASPPVVPYCDNWWKTEGLFSHMLYALNLQD